jgi:hypothetical protein
MVRGTLGSVVAIPHVSDTILWLVVGVLTQLKLNMCMDIARHFVPSHDARVLVAK